jgi:hypothetical protein
MGSGNNAAARARAGRCRMTGQLVFAFLLGFVIMQAVIRFCH